MRERTTALHAAAERSGIVAALFGGHASQPAYALYLRNLLPAYQAMELTNPAFAQPCLYRAKSIIADLDELIGADWPAILPLLPSAETYAARVMLARGGPLLIAHCYTRYLGDLNGGQLLARRLQLLFGRSFSALRFTDFPDADTLRRTYRDRLDDAGRLLADPASVVEEAAVAFQLNIDLSLDLEKAAVLLWPEVRF